MLQTSIIDSFLNDIPGGYNVDFNPVKLSFEDDKMSFEMTKLPQDEVKGPEPEEDNKPEFLSKQDLSDINNYLASIRTYYNISGVGMPYQVANAYKNTLRVCKSNPVPYQEAIDAVRALKEVYDKKRKRK